MEKFFYCVYILSNKYNEVFYTGMTDNICRRILEHKLKVHEGFTSMYNVDKLVYFDKIEDYEKAVKREKQIKAGSRAKKIALINSFNPDWHDLYNEVCS